MTGHIIKSWNAQADHMNQWATLGEDEKLAWAYQQGMERAAEICEAFQATLEPGMGECFSEEIRAHAQNQPKNVHDGSVV